MKVVILNTFNVSEKIQHCGYISNTKACLCYEKAHCCSEKKKKTKDVAAASTSTRFFALYPRLRTCVLLEAAAGEDGKLQQWPVGKWGVKRKRSSHVEISLCCLYIFKNIQTFESTKEDNEVITRNTTISKVIDDSSSTHFYFMKPLVGIIRLYYS